MPIIKKIKPFSVDNRGEMFHLLDGKVKILSCLLIASNKGSIRANHFHTKDRHYSYLVKGKMKYSYKTGDNKTKNVIINEGEMVYTPPKEIHAMYFLENSIFIALSPHKRDSLSYERDTHQYILVK